MRSTLPRTPTHGTAPTPQQEVIEMTLTTTAPLGANSTAAPRAAAPTVPPCASHRAPHRPTGRLLALGCTLLLLPGALAAQAGGAEEASPFPLHPADAQIRMAVQSLPENLRDDVTVLGYQAEGGVPVVLQRGDGAFVCLLSPPGVWVVESACYHRSLEPFMARGRELAQAGVTGSERVAIRNQEAEDGTLPVPTEPATMYVTVAPVEGVDPVTGAFSDSYSRSVIYVPFATGSSTGLSERPLQGSPWLMDAGTPRAHIMFAPSMELPEALQRAQQRAP